jgi:hypothetical protein
MNKLIAICFIIITASFCAKAQTLAWTYNWTNSGVDFTKVSGGVISFPSTNGITASAVNDANSSSAILWLNPSGGLIRKIKFKDMNITGFLYASTNAVVITGYNLDYSKSLIRTIKSTGSTNTLTTDGLYPSPDEVPSALCDTNFPASFADPRQLANFVNQSGFSTWTITSTNSATVTHYTLP